MIAAEASPRTFEQAAKVVGMLLLAGYLLFVHGCHSTADTELRLIVEMEATWREPMFIDE